jgi:hypothetical protein
MFVILDCFDVPLGLYASREKAITRRNFLEYETRGSEYKILDVGRPLDEDCVEVSCLELPWPGQLLQKDGATLC